MSVVAKKVWIPAAFVAATLCLTGCGGAGGGGQSGAAASPSPSVRVLSESQLKAALLAVGDLPTGYAVDTQSANPQPEGSTSASNPECQKLASMSDRTSPFEADKVAEAEVKFSKGTMGPFLVESVTSVRDPAKLRAGFTEVRKILTACSAFTQTDSSGTVNVTMAETSFPAVGDATLAILLTMKGSVGGTPFTAGGYLVVFTVGSAGCMVSHFGLPGVDVAETEKVVKAAADKVKQAR